MGEYLNKLWGQAILTRLMYLVAVGAALAWAVGCASTQDSAPLAPPATKEEWCARAFNLLGYDNIDYAQKQALLIKMEKYGCMDG